MAHRASQICTNLIQPTSYYYAFIVKNSIEYAAEKVYSFTTKELNSVTPVAVDVTLCFPFDDNFTLTAVKDGDNYPYYMWTEPGFETWWASGNAGYRLTGLKAQPMDYPAAPGLNSGVDGKNCLKLTTLDTGSLGAMVGMRIAAGALFTGSFDSREALSSNTLASTRMGVPFAHPPINMLGYYKYQPGNKMQDWSGREIIGARDEPDIYCVVYKNISPVGDPVQLDGSNILTHPAIVGIGRINHDEINYNNQWTQFNIAIVYNTSLEYSHVKDGLYSTAIVFTSSARGGEFIGAPGSTLWIDNVMLKSNY